VVNTLLSSRDCDDISATKYEQLSTLVFPIYPACFSDSALVDFRVKVDTLADGIATSLLERFFRSRLADRMLAPHSLSTQGRMQTKRSANASLKFVLHAIFRPLFFHADIQVDVRHTTGG
jgi:hypothetical protein